MTFLLILVLLGYVARVGGWLPPLAAVPAGVLAAFLLPGPAVVLAVGAPRSRVRDWILGPALSPVLLGGVAGLAIWRREDPVVWVHAAVLSAGLGLLLMRWTEGRAKGEGSVGRGAWLTGLGLAAVVAALVIPNPWLREGSDAWFHRAVVAEIARAGLPPEDPYFAGMPLQYFWFFHVALTALRIATGLAPAEAMALLNMVAAVGCVLVAARIGAALGFSRVGGAWGGALLLLGMGGLIWVFFPLKYLQIFIGDVRGMEEARTVMRFSPFVIPQVTASLQVLYSTTFMLRKFLVGTALPWSLLLALIAWDAGMRLAREGDPRQGALQFLAGVGAFLMHTVVGGALVAALASGGAATALFAAGARRRGAWIAVLAVGALAACVPYLLATMQPGQRSGPPLLGFQLLHVLSLPFSLAGVSLLALIALRRLWRMRAPAMILFLGITAACLAYGVFGRLPGPNQYDKLTLVAFVPLALAGGFGIPLLWAAMRARPRRRALFVLGMALFLIPENAISLVVFAVDSKAPVLSGQEEALFDWAGEETPSDAVFIDSADRVEMLVRGPRRQYWGNSGYAYQWGYPAEAMERRRALRDAVYEGTLTAEQLDDLRALGAPVFVIGRESDHPGIGARLLARPDRFRAVFSEGDLWVFEVRIPEGPRS